MLRCPGDASPIPVSIPRCEEARAIDSRPHPGSSPADGPTERDAVDIAIVGGGPAGLMAAQEVARLGRRAAVFDAKPGFGRKFLMAGRGGLNLTNTAPLERFLGRYRESRPALEKAVRAFGAEALRDFVHDLGFETFAGPSGRVFPACLKASPVLRAWLARLESAGVELFPRHRLVALDADGALRFETPDGPREVRPEGATLLALGGASWPRLGSDAAWVPLLTDLGIEVRPFRPANCGFEVDWSAHFIERFEGAPIKNVRLSTEGGDAVSRGEAVVTRYGLEGGGVYDLSAALRDAIARDGSATLRIDLKPDRTIADTESRLSRPRGKLSWSNFLRRTLRLTPVAIALLRECAHEALDREDPPMLARAIHGIPIVLTAPRPIEEAISSAGGIAMSDVDDTFRLRRLPRVYACGEMLDWEAPTGGYLLQACFATGRAAGIAAASRPSS